MDLSDRDDPNTVKIEVQDLLFCHFPVGILYQYPFLAASINDLVTFQSWNLWVSCPLSQAMSNIFLTFLFPLWNIYWLNVNILRGKLIKVGFVIKFGRTVLSIRVFFLPDTFYSLVSLVISGHCLKTDKYQQPFSLCLCQSTHHHALF